MHGYFKFYNIQFLCFNEDSYRNVPYLVIILLSIFSVLISLKHAFSNRSQFSNITFNLCEYIKNMIYLVNFKSESVLITHQTSTDRHNFCSLSLHISYLHPTKHFILRIQNFLGIIRVNSCLFRYHYINIICMVHRILFLHLKR